MGRKPGPVEKTWTAEDIELAREILTPIQWECWDRWTQGMGYRTIGYELGMRFEIVRDQVKAAEMKLQKRKRKLEQEREVSDERELRPAADEDGPLPS